MSDRVIIDCASLDRIYYTVSFQVSYIVDLEVHAICSSRKVHLRLANMPRLETQLVLPNACPHSQDHQDSGHKHHPQLDAECVLVVGRLRGSRDGRQLQHEQDIAADPVVLVHLLAVLHAAKDRHGQEVLGNPNQRLQNDDDIGDQAQDTVRGGQSRVIALVDLDEDKGCDKGERAHSQQSEVYAGSQGFLLRCCRGLQNQNCLHL